ncbi:MAG: DUF6168 family protein [Flavobacteriaceae bacterium]|nr:DUF6168 family protein [Flavobacteriaceae bacterium]
MNNPLKRFIFILTISVAVIFGLHILYLHFNNSPLFAHKIIPAYIMNYVLALSVYTLLYSFRAKFKTQLGFLFMAGSFLKFILFFIFFYSSYKADGDINTLEFSSFFIPYMICLVVETTSLVNLLNNLK